MAKIRNTRGGGGCHLIASLCVGTFLHLLWTLYGNTIGDSLRSENVMSSTVPKLYLMVGPRKMAASAIGASIREPAIKEALQLDGYCALDLDDMQMPRGHNRKNVYWRTLLQTLGECYSDHKHVLLVVNEWGLVDPEVWDSILKTEFSRWHINIIVGYRRWYSWMLGQYFEYYSSENWPETVDRIDEVFRRIQEQNTTLFTNEYIEHWEMLVGKDLNVLKYNLQEDKNVQKQLFCKILRGTEHTCNASVTETPANYIDFSFIYYSIAVEAYHRRLIKKEIKPWKAARKLYVYFTRRKGISLWDITEYCININLEEVFARSLELEKQIVPDWHVAAGGEELMREEFENDCLKLCRLPMGKIFSKYGYAVSEALNS